MNLQYCRVRTIKPNLNKGFVSNKLKNDIVDKMSIKPIHLGKLSK